MFTAAVAEEMNTPAVEGRVNTNGNPGLFGFMLLLIEVIHCVGVW